MLIYIYGLLIYTAVFQVGIFLKEIGVRNSYFFFQNHTKDLLQS